MIKKMLCIILAAVMFLSLTSCGIPGGGDDTGSGSSGSLENDQSAPGYVKGKWPKSVFDAQGIDEFTAGRIVYTESYDGKYEVYFDNCDADDMRAWTDKLFAKGFRTHEYDKERIDNAANNWNEVKIYEPNPGSPYRITLQWEFTESGSTFEWYGDEKDSAFVIQEETDEYGETSYYIRYTMRILLEPLNTQRAAEGTALGVKAEDLMFDNVRTVTLSDDGMTPGGKIYFYGDYLPTKEDHETFRCLLIDKLAAQGATFTGALDTSKQLSAQELKDQGIGSYTVTVGGNSYLLMDMSEYGHYGDALQFYFRQSTN